LNYNSLVQKMIKITYVNKMLDIYSTQIKTLTQLYSLIYVKCTNSNKTRKKDQSQKKKKKKLCEQLFQCQECDNAYQGRMNH